MFCTRPHLIALLLGLLLLFPANASVLITPERIATLKKRIAEKMEPNYSAYLELEKDAQTALNRKPAAPERWYVPRFYEGKNEHRAAKAGLQDDANSAYALALMYSMTGDEKYAKAAATFLNAWATQVQTLETKADSKLCFNYHFPALIFAADLIQNSPSWPVGEQAAFQNFVRDKALPMRTTRDSNNFGNWGVAFTLAAAAYLHDQELLENAIFRWKTLLREQQNSEGHLVEEVTRNGGTGDYGIWYSHFSLMAAALGAEIARVNGTDLFHHIEPKGKSLEKAYLALVPWVHNPSTFPYYKGKIEGLRNVDAIAYWELLNSRFPIQEATDLIQAKRPLSDTHSEMYLTFTHGNLAEDQ